MTLYELTEGGDLVHTTGTRLNHVPAYKRVSLFRSATPGPNSNRVLSHTEFYRMPTPLLRKALDILIKQGKAQVFKGVGEEGDGVKFV